MYSCFDVCIELEAHETKNNFGDNIIFSQNRALSRV